jgi:hypothetical protein
MDESPRNSAIVTHAHSDVLWANSSPGNRSQRARPPSAKLRPTIAPKLVSPNAILRSYCNTRTGRNSCRSRACEVSSVAKQVSSGPRIEFPRGAHDWCIVITSTAATTSSVRIQPAANTRRPILKNSRALAPFHTAGRMSWCELRPSGPSPESLAPDPADNHQSTMSLCFLLFCRYLSARQPAAKLRPTFTPKFISPIAILTSYCSKRTSRTSCRRAACEVGRVAKQVSFATKNRLSRCDAKPLDATCRNQ